MLRRLSGMAMLVALAAAGIAALVGPAAVAGADAAPHVTLDRSSAKPGERVIATFTGFTANSVTLAVCGNLARRGSSDCNMQAAQSDSRDQLHDSTWSELVVAAPPVPCPCVVRVSSTDQRELAITPIDVVGQPVAPVVGLPVGPLVSVTIDAKRAPQGLVAAIRSSLGGPTDYLVTVTVQNRTGETLRNVSVNASAGNRLNDDAVTADIPSPGPIPAGRTWTKAVAVKVPAPMLGRLQWRAVASGAGDPVSATNEVDPIPWLLVLVLIALVVDCGFFMVRRVNLRRERATAERPAEAPVMTRPEAPGTADTALA